MDDEFALLVADVYELAGVLRKRGESVAAMEKQSQARWQLMSVVSDGGLPVPAAAHRLGITRQAVQRVANDLVSDGLAVFGTNPGHRGSPVLTLTTEGRTSLVAMNRHARTVNRHTADHVGDDTVAAVRNGIHEILVALAQ